MSPLFLPFTKVDEAERRVWGLASTPTRDLDGEIVDVEAIKAALPAYMEWRNVREMHQPSAVGRTEEANVNEKGLYIGARIVDDDAWRKVKEKVYQGFSIGGNVTSRNGDHITGLELIEISLVDRPANPDCRIEVVKVAKSVDAIPSESAIARGQSHITPQRWESGVVLAPEEVGLFGRLLAKLAGSRAALGRMVSTNDDEDAGEVEYADPGYQDDGKKRYPIDTEEHIRAAWSYIHQEKNAAKYTNEQVAAIKRRIVAAWKREIGEAGPQEVSLVQHAGAAAALAAAAYSDSGAIQMAETEKRAASGRHAEHVRKAMHHLREAHKRAAAGMECLARGMSAEQAGHAAAAALMTSADGLSAAAHLSKAMEHFERLAERHVLAHHHLAAAAGTHAGEHGEQPSDAEDGIYKPEAGLTPLVQRDLTEGDVPEYEPTEPYPAKSAAAALKTAQAELLKAKEEAAYLRGKAEALEKLPQSPKARLFSVPRSALPAGEIEEPTTVEKLLKGVDLEATDVGERQRAGARMIGNMIANSATFARSVLNDPTFRGAAGR